MTMAALASLTGADQAASARSMSLTLDRYPEGLPSRPPLDITAHGTIDPLVVGIAQITKQGVYKSRGYSLNRSSLPWRSDQ